MMTATEVELVNTIAAHNEGIPKTHEDDEETPTFPGRPDHRVMVIEDDADVRDTVVDALVDAGYRARGFANGKQALDALDIDYMTSQYAGGSPVVPALILLDLMMPVMSGWDFYALLRRSRPQFAHVPVIVMSADHRISQFTEWAVNVAGLEVPRGSLAKPLGLVELLRKVRRAIGGHR